MGSKVPVTTTSTFWVVWGMPTAAHPGLKFLYGAHDDSAVLDLLVNVGDRPHGDR